MHAETHGRLWLEVTNGCNLKCQHCYSDSYPGSHRRDKLTESDYAGALHSAFLLGVRSVQFIGGEPTTYAKLPELIHLSSRIGFEHIEVFTNLQKMPEAVLHSLVAARGCLATSIYASCPGIHDQITQVTGSHARTILNLKKVLSAGVPVRASFIEMDFNLGQFEPTRQLLASVGVSNLQFDSIRDFGRAARTDERMEDLCGACAGSTACVSHDGTVYACIMSRKWPLGSIMELPLSDILSGPTAVRVRAKISDATRSISGAACGPECLPGTCHPNLPDGCPPNTCNPHLPSIKRSPVPGPWAH